MNLKGCCCDDINDEIKKVCLEKLFWMKLVGTTSCLRKRWWYWYDIYATDGRFVQNSNWERTVKKENLVPVDACRINSFQSEFFILDSNVPSVHQRCLPCCCVCLMDWSVCWHAIYPWHILLQNRTSNPFILIGLSKFLGTIIKLLNYFGLYELIFYFMCIQCKFNVFSLMNFSNFVTFVFVYGTAGQFLSVDSKFNIPK